MRARVLAVLLAVGAAPAVSSQQSTASVGSRLDGQLRDAVAAIVDSARRDGLPTEPLIDKALEGVSKRLDPRARVTDAMIVASVRRFAGELRLAKAALGPSSTPAEVKAAAVAIRNGVDIKQLERLRAVRAGQNTASALDIMSYIINKGVQADTASRVIVNVVLAGATDQQLQALQNDIERDIAGGTPAASAMSARGQTLATVIAGQTGGGAPGAGLPSGIRTRAADPVANGRIGGAEAGAASKVPAPLGKPKKP
jgi:hypothetical protein